MKYEKNVWYGWNGGECPVHPETVVEVVYSNWAGGEIKSITDPAKEASWGGGNLNLIAFRVIKEHKVPREFWLCEGDVYEDHDTAEYCCGDSEIIHVKEVLE